LSHFFAFFCENSSLAVRREKLMARVGGLGGYLEIGREINGRLKEAK